MVISYYLTDKEGRYTAKFFDQSNSQETLFTKSVNMISKELGYGRFDNLVKNSKLQFLKAHSLCKEYIEKGLAQPLPPEPCIADYCRDFWDFDGERITLLNKKCPGSIGRNSAYNQSLNFNKHILPFIKDPDMPVSKVTSKIINNIQDSLIAEGKLSNSTIKKAMQSISVPMNDYARKHPEYKCSLVAIDTIDGKPKKERGILTPTQVADIMKEFAREEKYERLDPSIRLSVAVAALTAMRMGEIQALTVEQITKVNDNESIILVNQALADHDGFKCPKGKRNRQTIIPTLVANALLERAYRNPNFKKGDHHIFWSTRGKRHIYTDSYIRKHFYHALELACGIDEEQRKERNIVFHSLRHGFISYLRGQVNDGIFRKAIGHEDEKTTDIYTHTNYENLKQISDKANATFSKVIEEVAVNDK